MMLRASMRALLELIHDLVCEEGPWIDKRTKIRDLASQDELTSLEEFASWFELPSND